MPDAYRRDLTPDTRVELNNSDTTLPDRSGGLSRKANTTLLHPQVQHKFAHGNVIAPVEGLECLIHACVHRISHANTF